MVATLQKVAITCALRAGITERIDTMKRTMKSVEITLEILRDTETGNVSAELKATVRKRHETYGLQQTQSATVSIPSVEGTHSDLTIDSVSYSSQLSHTLKQDVADMSALLERSVRSYENAFPVE
jgi:hypothetical protein